jgi:hypothetical protein
MGGGGVGPCLLQRLERRAGIGNLMDDVEQVAGRPCQPVQPGDNQNIAFAQCCQQALQLLAVAVGTGDLFLKDLGGTGLLQVGQFARPATAPGC